MRFARLAPGLGVLVLRAIAVPVRNLWADWIVVAALFSLGYGLSGEHPRAQRALGWAAGLWLTAIYAAHQGSWTLGALGLR